MGLYERDKPGNPRLGFSLLIGTVGGFGGITSKGRDVGFTEHPIDQSQNLDNRNSTIE